MATPSIGIVIVSFNTREKLDRCLSCLEPEFRVVVVDNGSTDDSVEWVRNHYPWVNVIANSDNRGFGAANNQGIEFLGTEIVLLLNSDCYAQEASILRLASVFSDPTVVAAGGKLLNPDGTLQESIAGPLTLWAVWCEQTYLDGLLRRAAPSLAYWRTRQALDRANPVAEVNQVMGACLMMRPKERFDERFFLYVEDTDLCQRLKRHGRILYVPEAEFVHELGSSSKASPWLAIARYNRGKELYFSLHHGPLAAASCFLMNRLGALLRLIIWLIPSIDIRYRSKPATFWRVMTCPISGPTR